VAISNALAKGFGLNKWAIDLARDLLMKNTSPEVDAYIENAPEFARPMLKRLRKVIHKGCPQVVETIKWGVPMFEHHGILGGLAAFKQYVRFGFWKAALMSDPHGLMPADGSKSMMGLKLYELSNLPADKILVEYVREAALLNEQGMKPSKPKKKAAKPVVLPEDLQAALKKNAKARTTFEAFPPSHQREYIKWIVEAKQATTRERRLATTLEWLTHGKSRNWKYVTK
jgi:uncharacterized protein YdeI (YjbR/CyaY-like superfamily)